MCRGAAGAVGLISSIFGVISSILDMWFKYRVIIGLFSSKVTKETKIEYLKKFIKINTMKRKCQAKSLADDMQI